MTTFVGRQSQFEDAIKALLELEYDALEAYIAAISRLETKHYKDKLIEFSNDHRHHINNISEFLNLNDIDFFSGPSSKRWLTKGKVVLSELLGDNAILAAMLANEADTNVAYENMQARKDNWKGADEIIVQGLNDERRHKVWIKAQLE